MAICPEVVRAANRPMRASTSADARAIEVARCAAAKDVRFVFELYRLEGKTQRVIAKIVGVSATLAVNFYDQGCDDGAAGCRDIPDDRRRQGAYAPTGAVRAVSCRPGNITDACIAGVDTPVAAPGHGNFI